MIKKQFYALAAGLCLLASNGLFGQSKIHLAAKTEADNPTEKYLGSPDYREGTQVLPVGIDLYSGDEVNTIHYGRTPANSSGKPVLIFVHGYASNARVFFTGEDNMYADVYRDGYRSAYVSLRPNDDMWYNGALLANMISRIKSHYNGAPIVMIGWSKGGIDIDAALVHYGAHDKVSEVFTLSSPHFGTGIAEVANSVLLSLVNIIFMQNNDATLSLQRGYMNYFRSITDGSPNNTIAYTTIGGWGNGPLNRLDIPQNLLHGLGGPKSTGGNDGVVPYSSSRRPGGKELFGGLKKYRGFLGIPYYDGPDQTNLDHFEVTRGSKVWPHIRNELTRSGRQESPAGETPVINPNRVVTSNMQWVTSSRHGYFVVSSQNTGSTVMMLSDQEQPLLLLDEAGKTYHFAPNTTEATTGKQYFYRTDGLKPGRYYLGNQQAIAFMTQQQGPEMILDMGSQLIMNSSEDGALDMSLAFRGVRQEEEIIVEAYLIQVSDLDLNRIESQKIPLEVRPGSGQYFFDAGKKLANGIYQLMIQAKGNNFRRDLLTSFAVNGEADPETVATLAQDWIIYPNPASKTITIRLAEDKVTAVTIYSIKGEKIYTRVVQSGIAEVQLSLADYQQGIYLIEVVADGQRSHKRLIIE